MTISSCSYFVIQSGQYSADELQERSEIFLKELPDAFEAIDDATFERLRSAAIAEVEQKPKSIAEKAGQFFEVVYDLDQDFERNSKTLSALKAISQEEVAEIFRKSLSNDNGGRRLVLAYGREHLENPDKLDGIENLEDWKQRHSYE